IHPVVTRHRCDNQGDRTGGGGDHRWTTTSKGDRNGHDHRGKQSYCRIYTSKNGKGDGFRNQSQGYCQSGQNFFTDTSPRGKGVEEGRDDPVGSLFLLRGGGGARSCRASFNHEYRSRRGRSEAPARRSLIVVVPRRSRLVRREGR